MAQRSVPYNNDAENYVLGSILIDANVINGVSGTLSVNDFYNEDNRKVYEAMLSLFKNQSPIEVLLLIDELKRLLAQYDYIGVKIATGCATISDYKDIIEMCEGYRQEIRALSKGDK